MPIRVGLVAVVLAVAGAGVGGPRPGGAASPDAAVRFGRDVLPILSDNCFLCHGPDAKARKADLRLDTHDGALAVIVPGKSAESELVRRITAADDERMPPPKTKRALTPAQKETLRRWIDQGAPWGKHWAYESPERPPVPEIQDAKSRIRNPIDAFVLARLRVEGLSPGHPLAGRPEADKATLLRRVTLDLTGLPPTLAEIDAFLADTSPGAYERVVDRLLASPRYGERMAADWLDVARFADTNGYQNDFARSMWPWRDWVIAAFNRNQPFDQFVVEQLAGDLLPNPTLEQRIATGFNRNNRTVTEAGSIEEEWRVENAVDRVETTATAFLGVTMGCCRCHDHKFDPFTQREFYQFLAYFNSVNEKGFYSETPGNVPPLIQVRSAEDERRVKQFDEAIAAAAKAVKSEEASLAERQQKWEDGLRTTPPPADPRDWAVRFPLAGDFHGQVGTHDLTPRYSSPAAATREGEAPAEPNGPVRQEPRPPGRSFAGKAVGGLGFTADGPISKALRLDGKEKTFVDAGQAVHPERDQSFSYGAWVKPRGNGGAILSKMDDAAAFRGFDLLLLGQERSQRKNRVAVHLVHHWPDDAVKIQTRDPLPADAWSHVFVTYDGSGKAAGVTLYVNGQRAPTMVVNDHLTGTIATDQPLRLGARSGSAPLAGDLADVRVYPRALTADEVKAVAVQPLALAVEPPADARTPGQQALLGQVFRATFGTELVEARRREEQAKQEKAAHEKRVPTVMVMEDLPKPRPTYVLKRGQYDVPDKSQQVEPGVPACLPPLPAGASKNRLGLARWLIAPANPLLARVTVNRFWQRYFGTGLVATAEDFGVRGERPSHPELLDWLAVEFRESGWDVKHLQKLIVTSATYRQASKASPALLHKDPENRLLARGPRFRLPAEVVRDNALAAAGLLTERLGGPSVKPYQPAGLWEELAGGAGEGPYVQDKGPNLYRRSLYVYRKRTVPHPEMATFDAGSREVCQVKRARTNTPLQALELLNDVTYVEAARRLAERMLTEGGRSPSDRLTFAFRRATGRPPTAAELQVLTRGLDRYRDQFDADPDSAKKFVHQGESPVNDKLDPVELAAYAAVAGVILNLDETITKE
jgi:hypothetical protein